MLIYTGLQLRDTIISPVRFLTNLGGISR